MKLNTVFFVFLVVLSTLSNANVRYWKLVITERFNKDNTIETVWFKTVDEGENNRTTTTVLISSLNGRFADHFPDLNGYQIKSLVSGKYCSFTINGQQGPSYVTDGNIVLNNIASLSYSYFGQSRSHSKFLIPLYPLVQSNPLSISSVGLDSSGLHTFHFGYRQADSFSCLWCETLINEEQQRRWIFHWANNDFGYTLQEVSESEIDLPKPENAT